MNFSIDFLLANSYWSDLWSKIHQNLIAENRYMMLLNGLLVTLQVTFFAIIIGTVLGVLLALMKMSKSKVLSTISNFYITVIRGTPMVTQLLIIYFVVFASVNISKVLVAIIAFGINSGAYVAEIIRAGIQAVDRGQTEAGRSLGLSSRQTMFLIIMPQAVKNIFPTYVNEFIVLVKETAIVGYIALEDLTKAGDIIRSRTYEAFIPLLSVAFIYLAITTILAKLCDIVERRLNRHDKR